MFATSVFYSQIYPSLLPGRQFPNLAVSTPAGLLGALAPIPPRFGWGYEFMPNRRCSVQRVRLICLSFSRT
jgi:hypothetical protein